MKLLMTLKSIFIKIILTIYFSVIIRVCVPLFVCMVKEAKLG